MKANQHNPRGPGARPIPKTDRWLTLNLSWADAAQARRELRDKLRDADGDYPVLTEFKVILDRFLGEDD